MIEGFLLIFYVLVLVYMVVRSGPGGLAFIIDTHMAAVICAIVLSQASGSLCRKAINLFLMFASFNSLVGIAEGIGHFRAFQYKDVWPVLDEQHFRATAFEGHPLENATFTTVALFTALGMS